MQAKSRLLLTK